MTIADSGKGSKEADIPPPSLLRPAFRSDILVVGALVATTAAGFGIGSAFSHAPSAAGETTQTAAVYDASVPSSNDVQKPTVSHTSATKALPKVVGHASGTYVASKNGTKYYLPTCASANRIKDENKIWFLSKEEAAAAGYAPSSTCKGL